MMEKKYMQKNRWISVFIILIMVLSGFIAMAGAAEENETSETKHTGAIVGKVITPDGDPLEGIIIYLSLSNEVIAKQETNERGYFEINDLARGIYIMKVDEADHEPWSKEVKVPAGEKVEVKVVLEKVNERKFGFVCGVVINALENEPIVKSGVDKFYQTDLEKILTSKDIKQVIIVGTAAQGAVLHTATGAAQRQMEIVIPVDGLSAGEPYAEQYTVWHLANAPGTRRSVTLTKIDWIKIE